MLGEADDRRAVARPELGERVQLAVLGLLGLGVERPAVRAAVRVAEPLVHPVDHVVGERVAEQVGLHVRLRGRVAEEVGEPALDQAVAADDLLGPLASGGGEDRLPVLAALDEALRLEPLQHLAGGGPRDAEHLRDARRQRRRAGHGRAVLADREGEEVDRLEVLVG